MTKDLIIILNYIEETEKAHFEESGCPDDHIYASALRVRQGLAMVRNELNETLGGVEIE